MGLVECEVFLNESLKRPVLPDNDAGTIVDHNNKLVGTWTTLDLRKALEMAYQITQVHAAASYTSVKCLMKYYVIHVLRVKICNNPLGKEQCDDVNNYHKGICFKDWKDISPEYASGTPGLKQVTKLCLNSLWGKAARRSGLTPSNLFDNYFDSYQ